MGDIKTYKWRDKRLTADRDEVAVEYKMIDMGSIELQHAYDHCKHMLYNTDKNNLGRMLVLDEISQQLEYCGAELALRWFKEQKDAQGNFLWTEDNLMINLRTWLSSITDYDPNKTYRLQDFLEVPPEFKSISVEALKNACRDNLGYFNHSKISLAFIFRMGIYFKPDELETINKRVYSSTLKEKFDVLKSQTGLKDDAPLRANPSGLTEAEFRDLVYLKKHKGFKKSKYSEMPSSLLEVLRKKVLYAFEEEVLYQVSTWTTLMKQIEEVADYKGFLLQ